MQIHELPAQTTAANADTIAIDNGDTTQKITAQNLKKYTIGSTSISGVGDGTVTGAISALNSDLDWKLLTATATHTFSSQSNGVFDFDVSSILPSGYRITSIVDINLSGTWSEYLVLRRFSISNGSKHIFLDYRCLTSSSSVNATCSIYFLATPSGRVS